MNEEFYRFLNCSVCVNRSFSQWLLQIKFMTSFSNDTHCRNSLVFSFVLLILYLQWTKSVYCWCPLPQQQWNIFNTLNRSRWKDSKRKGLHRSGFCVIYVYWAQLKIAKISFKFLDVLLNRTSTNALSLTHFKIIYDQFLNEKGFAFGC